jgi:hypothetical protein
VVFVAPKAAMTLLRPTPKFARQRRRRRTMLSLANFDPPARGGYRSITRITPAIAAGMSDKL